MLVNVDVSFSILEMPIVYVIKNNFFPIGNFYGVIILIAIFTTAVSVGISFLNNACKNKKSFAQVATIMCITSIAISNIGFSNLVKILFPVFGYLGMAQIHLIFKNKNVEKRGRHKLIKIQNESCSSVAFQSAEKLEILQFDYNIYILVTFKKMLEMKNKIC